MEALTAFRQGLAFVLRHEGGDVNDPDDPGGATSRGVTQNAYDKYRFRHGDPLRPVFNASDAEIAQVYREDYWDATSCSEFPKKIGIYLFDAAVQHSPRQSIKILQRALAIEDDGVVGPMTINAAGSEPLKRVTRDMLAKRMVFYGKVLVNRYIQFWKRTPDEYKARIYSVKYAYGWFRRVIDLAML